MRLNLSMKRWTICGIGELGLNSKISHQVWEQISILWLWIKLSWFQARILFLRIVSLMVSQNFLIALDLYMISCPFLNFNHQIQANLWLLSIFGFIRRLLDILDSGHRSLPILPYNVCQIRAARPMDQRVEHRSDRDSLIFFLLYLNAKCTMIWKLRQNILEIFLYNIFILFENAFMKE